MSDIKNTEALFDILESCPKNQTVVNNLVKAWAIINSKKYEKIVCAISGGVIQM